MNRDSVRDALAELPTTVIDVIHSVEQRCMAADGPVTPTCDEITDKELRKMYVAATAARAALSAQPMPREHKLLTDEQIDEACKSEPAAVYELMHGHEITVERFRNALRTVVRAVERLIVSTME